MPAHVGPPTPYTMEPESRVADMAQSDRRSSIARGDHESVNSNNDADVFVEEVNKTTRVGGRTSNDTGGRFTKSRLFGRSHWMNKLDQVSTHLFVIIKVNQT